MRRLAVALLVSAIPGCFAPDLPAPAPMPRWMNASEAGTDATPARHKGRPAPPSDEAASRPDVEGGDAGGTASARTDPLEPAAGKPDAGERATRRLGLAEALDEALTGNVDLALSRAEQEVAAARLDMSRGAFLPFLELGAGYSRTQGRVQGSFGDLMDVDFDTYEGMVGFGWRLNLSADRHLVEAAEQERERAGVGTGETSP